VIVVWVYGSGELVEWKLCALEGVGVLRGVYWRCEGAFWSWRCFWSCEESYR